MGIGIWNLECAQPRRYFLSQRLRGKIQMETDALNLVIGGEEWRIGRLVIGAEWSRRGQRKKFGEALKRRLRILSGLLQGYRKSIAEQGCNGG